MTDVEVSWEWTPPSPAIGMTVRVASTVGMRSSNQDRALVAGPIVAVADGVGGSTRGDAAAQVALGRIGIDSALIGRHVPPWKAVAALIEGADAQAHHATTIFGGVETSTTLSMVHVSRWIDWEHRIDDPNAPDDLVRTPRGLIDNEVAIDEVAPRLPIAEVNGEGPILLTFAWVGDSPIFLSDSCGIRQISAPHTTAPTGHAGNGFPLQRALGTNEAQPDIRFYRVNPDSRIVIATDGLLDTPQPERNHIITTARTPQKCLNQLLNLTTNHHVRDNTTLAVIDLTHPHPHTPTPTHTLR